MRIVLLTGAACLMPLMACGCHTIQAKRRSEQLKADPQRTVRPQEAQAAKRRCTAHYRLTATLDTRQDFKGAVRVLSVPRWVAYILSQPSRRPDKRILRRDRKRVALVYNLSLDGKGGFGVYLFVRGKPTCAGCYTPLWEVRIPLDNRPIHNLKWNPDGTLTFSQMSQPHYGFRYTVDVARKLTVRTEILSDCVHHRTCCSWK
jgi:hypothetical protein